MIIIDFGSTDMQQKKKKKKTSPKVLLLCFACG